MTEQQQATLMTEQQLKDAGYIFTDKRYKGFIVVSAPDEWEYEGRPLSDCLKAATAHYQQQQELARLRAFKAEVIDSYYRADGDYYQAFKWIVHTFYTNEETNAAFNAIEDETENTTD